MGLVAAVYGMIMPILNTIYLTLIQTKVPVDKMGRISSIDWAVSLAISPFWTLFAGFIATQLVTLSGLLMRHE